jgi:hypothetical protein
MEHAKFEVQDWLQRKVEKEGLNPLNEILKGVSGFDELFVEI